MVDYQKLKTNFDLYGKITSFEETFNSIITILIIFFQL